MAERHRRNPLRVPARSWGHFVRLPRSTQIRTLAVVGVVVVGTVAWIAAAPSSSSTEAAPTGGLATGQPTGGSTAAVGHASTSTRGVTERTINVVFPVVSLSSLAGQEGFAADPEFGEQTKAIQFYVKQVNDSGGINGRAINPIITTFDPTSESAMRALCKTWTEGSPAAFAVVDGLGAWTGDNQLCIAQEGHTPFIGQWTTVTNWTTLGSPYLWWTGPDQSAILAAGVQWGLRSDLIGGSHKVGVIAGDRASDQLALNGHLGAEEMLVHDIFDGEHQWHGARAHPFLEERLGTP